MQQRQAWAPSPGGPGCAAEEGWALGGCLVSMLIGIGVMLLIFAWPFLLALVAVLAAFALVVRAFVFLVGAFVHVVVLLVSWIRPGDRRLR